MQGALAFGGGTGALTPRDRALNSVRLQRSQEQQQQQLQQSAVKLPKWSGCSVRARKLCLPVAAVEDGVSDSYNASEDGETTTSGNGACELEHPAKRPVPGLFRTPISGGVETATSSHDLPRPALAVRNLMEQARYAHLCTTMSRMHHRRFGYPFGTLVDFAADSSGHPIFALSPLEIHTRNLQADPRCTLVVQVPGFSGLGNARATLFGDVHPLPQDMQEWARKHYVIKHQLGATQQWGNFQYYRMERISDILFVGGFGTVAWVNVEEYEGANPDLIAADGDEDTLKELNAMFSRPLSELLSAESQSEIDDAVVISIDSKGVDIRVRQGSKFLVQRLSFDGGHPVETLDEAKAALNTLLVNRTKQLSH